MAKDELLLITMFGLMIGSLMIKCFGFQIGLAFTTFIIGGSTILYELGNLLKKAIKR